LINGNLRQLLDVDESVTKDEAISYMMNVHDLLATAWQNALQNAISTVGRARMADQEFAAAVNGILQWNGDFTADTTASNLVNVWRLKAEKNLDTVNDPLPLFDRVAIEVFKPGSTEPCPECSREFEIDDERMRARTISVGIALPPSVSGYHARVRPMRRSRPPATTSAISTKTACATTTSSIRAPASRRTRCAARR
jgi:hypothetical protein